MDYLLAFDNIHYVRYLLKRKVRTIIRDYINFLLSRIIND